MLSDMHDQVVLAEIRFVVDFARKYNRAVLRVDAEFGRLVPLTREQRVAQVLLIVMVRVEGLGSHLDHIEADGRILAYVDLEVMMKAFVRKMFIIYFY